MSRAPTPDFDLFSLLKTPTPASDRLIELVICSTQLPASLDVLWRHFLLQFCNINVPFPKGYTGLYAMWDQTTHTPRRSSAFTPTIDLPGNLESNSVANSTLRRLLFTFSINDIAASSDGLCGARTNGQPAQIGVHTNRFMQPQFVHPDGPSDGPRSSAIRVHSLFTGET